jgi:transposase
MKRKTLLEKTKNKSIYQVTAEEMKKKGHSVDYIAHDLKVSISQVRRWVG